MSDTKRLAFSILQFLHDQLHSGSLTSDAKESLEVAVQCLETAYEISTDDQSLAVPMTLPEIFNDATAKMKVENYSAAVEFYSQAIALNPQNAVYYCNR
ncbi:hypothetical protein NQD34_002935 [Periophthalmus magnuspinnatus]|nr:hypothetical protein NQD34_002935 [Periophthalmus magnuspinnatus]